MTTKKEQFGVSIQSVIQSIDEVTAELQRTRQLCQEVLAELQDESKLGTISEFDFGKTQLKDEARRIHKEIRSKLEDIEKQLRSLQEPMKREQSRTRAQMTDKVDSPPKN